MKSNWILIILIIVSISLGISAALFGIANKHINAHWSKELINAIRSSDVETAQNIVEEHPNCVNSLPTITPYIWRLICELPDVHYPLQEACIWENYDIVQLLIENGANVNFCVTRELESSAPPLTCIVKVHRKKPWEKEPKQIDEIDLEIIRLLLANGADKTIKDRHGKTAYDYAVELNDSNLEELLKY